MERAREIAMSPNSAPAQRQWSRFKYPQSLIRYGVLLGVLMFLAYSVYYLNIPLERFMGMFGRIGDLLVDRYYPPDLEYIADRDYSSWPLDAIGTGSEDGQSNETYGFELVFEGQVNDRLHFTAGINYFDETAFNGSNTCYSGLKD